MNRIEIGQMGEQLAQDYLIEKGYEILAKNYRTPLGELDLVAQKDETLVFIEVRTRRTRRFGTAEESITKVKKERIIRLALQFCAQYYLYSKSLRFDVIAIDLFDDKPEIRHIPNAFYKEV